MKRNLFREAIGCARTGDLAGARSMLTSSRSFVIDCRKEIKVGRATPTWWKYNIDRRGMAGPCGKREADAVRLMKSRLPWKKPRSKFVPAPLLAGNEQLGDLLLEQNQPEQALVAYEASLQLALIGSTVSSVADEPQN